MTMADTPRRRSTPLRASETPAIAPRKAPIPPPAAPFAPANLPPPATPTAVSDPALAQAKAAAAHEMLVGAVFLVIGAVITFVWWRIAVGDAESDGSGSYMVFYGPMLYGAFRLARGCWYRMDPRRLLDRR